MLADDAELNSALGPSRVRSLQVSNYDWEGTEISK